LVGAFGWGERAGGEGETGGGGPMPQGRPVGEGMAGGVEGRPREAGLGVGWPGSGPKGGPGCARGRGGSLGGAIPGGLDSGGRPQRGRVCSGKKKPGPGPTKPTAKRTRGRGRPSTCPGASKGPGGNWVPDVRGGQGAARPSRGGNPLGDAAPRMRPTKRLEAGPRGEPGGAPRGKYPPRVAGQGLGGAPIPGWFGTAVGPR